MAESNIRTGIVFGDVHVPHEDKRATSILMQVCSEINPDILIDLGDTCDFPSVNHWIQAGSRQAEGQRLCKDLKRMFEFSSEVEESCYNNDRLKKVRLIGNHENWLVRFMDNIPQISGLRELNIGQTYRDMGWEVVPFGEFYVEGKLAFHHGDRRGYQGKHHSAQWALLGKNIVYGHRHDVQRFTHETLTQKGKPSRHAAFSIGCLCRFDFDYMTNKKVNWQQGFGVFEMDEKGYFGFNHIDIHNGRAIFRGREWKG